MGLAGVHAGTFWKTQHKDILSTPPFQHTHPSFPPTQRLCNQQQRLGSIKSTCRLNNEIINVGPRMSAVACNPEKVPPALRPLLAPVPAVRGVVGCIRYC